MTFSEQFSLNVRRELRQKFKKWLLKICKGLESEYEISWEWSGYQFPIKFNVNKYFNIVNI